MKSGPETARRLASAIRQFLERENLCLRAGQWTRALASSARAAPLIAHLSALGAADASVRAAISRQVPGLLELRRQSQAMIAARRQAVADELRRIADARASLRLLRPAYTRRPTKNRLNATV